MVAVNHNFCEGRSRGMPELTGEAIILRHSDKFDAKVQVAARERLSEAGVEVDRLPTSPIS